MYAVKGIFTAFWFCALLSAAQALSFFRDCDKPKEGVWAVEHYIPTAPGVDELTLQARSNITLEEVFPNAYKGVGIGELIASVLQPNADGVVSTYDLVGLFDPENCLLTGTIYDFDQGFNDPFRWMVGDNSMTGPYLNNANKTVLFTTFALHELVFIEPLK